MLPFKGQERHLLARVRPLLLALYSTFLGLCTTCRSILQPRVPLHQHIQLRPRSHSQTNALL